MWRQRLRWRPANHPLLLAMRFENVFFSVRPIVLSLARSTMCSSTTFSSSRRRLHLAKPPAEEVSAINFASAAPSKIRGRRSWDCICGQHRLQPFLNQLAPVRSTVAMLCPAPRQSGCHSSPRPHPIHPPSRGCAPSSATGGTLAFPDQLVEPIAFLRDEPNHVFLDGNLFPGHESSLSALPRENSEIPVMINDGDSSKPLKRCSRWYFSQDTTQLRPSGRMNAEADSRLIRQGMNINTTIMLCRD